MKKISPNSVCPCGSRRKYKKCCQVYHNGTHPLDALTLMKSRYSAYASGDSRYIIRTTHPSNIDYSADTSLWKKDIDTFCKETEFIGLEILSHADGEKESYVTFKAILSSGVMIEKSRFLYEDGIWLYADGTFDDEVSESL